MLDSGLVVILFVVLSMRKDRKCTVCMLSGFPKKLMLRLVYAGRRQMKRNSDFVETFMSIVNLAFLATFGCNYIRAKAKTFSDLCRYSL